MVQYITDAPGVSVVKVPISQAVVVGNHCYINY
jgi:hypothetical protein